MTPIAWMYVDNVGTHYTDCKSDWYDAPGIEEVTPLYAKCEWVGLTDEEIWSNGSCLALSADGVREFARLIEVKLKEKNT